MVLCLFLLDLLCSGLVHYVVLYCIICMIDLKYKLIMLT